MPRHTFGADTGREMSEENVETIRRAVDAFNRGDRSGWLAHIDPDAVMIPAREWPENAPIRGAEAIWDFYMEVTGAWDEGSIELGDVIDSGADTVVTNNRRSARGRTSGAGVEFSYWVVATFRNGTWVRIEWFANREEALEAAGHSE